MTLEYRRAFEPIVLPFKYIVSPSSHHTPADPGAGASHSKPDHNLPRFLHYALFHAFHDECVGRTALGRTAYFALLNPLEPKCACGRMVEKHKKLLKILRAQNFSMQFHFTLTC